MNGKISFKPTLERLRKELEYHEDKVEELKLQVISHEKLVADEELEISGESIDISLTIQEKHLIIDCLMDKARKMDMLMKGEGTCKDILKDIQNCCFLVCDKLHEATK